MQSLYITYDKVSQKDLKVQKLDYVFIKELDLFSFLSNNMKISYYYFKFFIMLDTIQNQLALSED
jgi:hypothetical protein